ncbi:hypothetical protein TraAM80_04919 [Trypanosoma rangeli]|uniref:Uncharacterized protein n=1 Tax=Trypanosoma rangeli TaxID=5698 RepID=A0A422NH45_TRYRA|nr:uncharacterized protein TraAM80_04919 [Trypanosoma rangeli]RNF04793.1 hypothetical protein TraAM80_04919 [Trypanosoma rangeli]|eukprot:RNF04793.1 hypothetical protein TraAM80_04919 [Trypanosoma rangeli]
MRGNRLARSGDPMKTRSQRRKERRERISRTNRAQRERRRIGRFVARKCVREEDQHMTAIMESYAKRRKAERDAERAAQQQQEQEEMEEGGKEGVVHHGGQKVGQLSRVTAKQSLQCHPARGAPSNDRKLVRRGQPKVMTRSLY